MSRATPSMAKPGTCGYSMVATSGALPALAALLSLAYPPWPPEGICWKTTWIRFWPRLKASTTSWLPRRADQKVMRTGPALVVLRPPPDVHAPRAPASGSANPAANTDRRLGGPGIVASSRRCDTRSLTT